MNAEELAEEQAGRPLQFDAHEFDGLRDALEKEAEGLLGKVDQFVRDNPWTCIAIAAAAGLTLSCLLRRNGAIMLRRGVRQILVNFSSTVF